MTQPVVRPPAAETLKQMLTDFLTERCGGVNPAVEIQVFGEGTVQGKLYLMVEANIDIPMFLAASERQSTGREEAG